MTPARSVAASVAALGFASTLTAPMPALAVPAPAPCQRIEHFAAQAGAEILRINRLDLGSRAAGQEGTAQAGAGQAGDAEEGAGRAGSGQTGAGRAGSGQTGAGRAGSDRAGTGRAGTGQEGTGRAGSAREGTDQEGEAREGAGEDRVGRKGTARTGVRREVPDAAGPADESSPELDSSPAPSEGAATSGFAPAAHRVRADRKIPQSIGGVGLGDARSVMIADGPIKSAAAARILDGRVAGSSDRNDLVVQQAPPSNGKPTVRRTGEKRFGPFRAGAGELTAHARWNDDMTCASTEAQASRSSAELERVTLTGAGSDSLLRVPEKISGRSDTAVRQRDGRPESVAWATISAGRISLAGGAVRIRVVRAPELRVSMSPAGEGEVDYRPAVVEVTDGNGRAKRLATASDSIEITVREEAHEPESLPALIEPISPLPLPKLPGLPSPGATESAPAPENSSGTRLRISLGDVRHATKGSAIAARATAIKVSLIRDEDPGRAKRGYTPSSVAADLGIGLLEGAAVAPAPAASGQGVSSAGVGAGLPITGPGVFSLLLAGAGLLVGGAAAVFAASRRRRFNS